MKTKARIILRMIKKVLSLDISQNKTLANQYPQYEIGESSYGDIDIKTWGEEAKLYVGNYTSFAPGVKVLLGGDHRIDWVTTFPFNVFWKSAIDIHGHPKTKGNVVIGNDVWIGTEAMIFSGVTIGDGAVIGGRAVVSRNVPPYSVVVGNPARVIKYRFDEETISRLMAIKWWDWDKKKIAMAIPDMLNDNISIFIEKSERGEYR